MGITNNAIGLLIKLIAPLLCLTLFQRCIKDDVSRCLEDDYLLYVKIADTETGEDITETGVVSNATLYLFDAEEKFVALYSLSAQQIAGRQPVIISGFKPQGMKVTAWGNLAEAVEISDPADLSGMKLSLREYPYENGYQQLPPDLFYGFKVLGQHTRNSHSDEIILKQKNAKLHITIRGLNDNETGYYFKIANTHNGYDFMGNPVEQQSTGKTAGTFNKNADYVTPQPLYMIHNDAAKRAAYGSGVWVYVLQQSGANDTEICKTNMDSNGDFIRLIQGKTTNVLLDLTDNGDLNVFIKITPWDEVYQWWEY